MCVRKEVSILRIIYHRPPSTHTHPLPPSPLVQWAFLLALEVLSPRKYLCRIAMRYPNMASARMSNSISWSTAIRSSSESTPRESSPLFTTVASHTSSALASSPIFPPPLFRPRARHHLRSAVRLHPLMPMPYNTWIGQRDRRPLMFLRHSASRGPSGRQLGDTTTT